MTKISNEKTSFSIKERWTSFGIWNLDFIIILKSKMTRPLLFFLDS